MPTSATCLTLFHVNTDKQAQLRNSLLNGGLVLAQNSVASSTQRTYNSTWKKWIVFMQTCNHNPTAASINCTQTSHDHLLQLLLMFISYCVDTIHKAPTSIPGIMSALRYQFNMRCVNSDVTAAFDHCLIQAAKAGVARRPYEPKVRLPCTYAMIQHIVQQNTQDGFTMDNLMLAVGVSMAYHLCLRISEYASKTKIPHPESHQFDSKSVEFQCSTTYALIPSFALRTTSWYNIKLVKFTIQHAKNVRAGYGIPICFTTHDATEDALAFLQLVYIWAHLSERHLNDPFLSYRSRKGHLICLVYTQVQQAITQCAEEFGFNPAWFKPHCIRMAAPTALRAAGGSDGQVLTLGRWKSVPTSLVYQGPSSKNNNRILQLIADPTLFTSLDILLSRFLPSANRTIQRQVVRRF